MIHTGDCIEVMATMPADSVDAVVTDPPYGLEFMGKAWDAFRSDDPGTQRHRGERAGSHGDLKAGDNTTVLAAGRVAYGGGQKPKTNRCVTCGKRDQFRNPHACGDAAVWKSELIDPYSAPPTSLAFQNWCRTWALEALRVTKPGGYLLAFGGTRTHHRLVCGLEDAGWIIRDELDWIYASGFPKGKANLKPAHEPIVLARKPGPLRPLGIEETRIGFASEADEESAAALLALRKNHPGGAPTYGSGKGMPPPPSDVAINPAGRWPSNVLLSDPELFDEPNPYVVGSGATSDSTPFRWSQNNSTIFGQPFGESPDGGYGDSGGYARFFIVPKADRADREPVLRGQLTPQDVFKGHQPDNPRCLSCGLQRVGALGAEACSCEEPEWAVVGDKQRENAHPTVKPTDLMRHLVRLVTPSGGTVLDPFLGSGSTAIACELEGFPWIGIEKEPEYVAIAEARLNGTQRGLGLDVPAPTRKRSTRESKDPNRFDGVPRWQDWKARQVGGDEDVA